MKEISLFAIIRALENPGQKIYLITEDIESVRLEILTGLVRGNVGEPITRRADATTIVFQNRAEIHFKTFNQIGDKFLADVILVEGTRSEVGINDIRKLKGRFSPLHPVISYLTDKYFKSNDFDLKKRPEYFGRRIKRKIMPSFWGRKKR
jgi:hypothetical protein